MKQSTVIVGVSSLVLGAVMVGAVRGQVQLPSAISNLTQTLKKSLILNDSQQPQIILNGEEGEIQISTGAFRDKSIVPEDIVGYAQRVAEALGCTGGKILHGIENGRSKCMDMPQVTQWKSSDSGRNSIYFVKKKKNKSPAVAVGTTSDVAHDKLASDNGLAVKGDTSISKALVVGNGLKIIKKGNQKVITSRGFWPWSEVYAQQNGTDYSEVAHNNKVTVGSMNRFDDKKSITIGTDVSHQEGGVTIGGDVAVDGGWYLTNPKKTSAFVLSEVDGGGWLTSRAKKNNNYASSRIIFDSDVVIGGHKSTDSTLEVKGDVHVKDADFIMKKPRTAGGVDATKKGGDECVALSLDKQGEVVLVNVCEGYQGVEDPKICSKDSDCSNGFCNFSSVKGSDVQCRSQGVCEANEAVVFSGKGCDSCPFEDYLGQRTLTKKREGTRRTRDTYCFSFNSPELLGSKCSWRTRSRSLLAAWSGSVDKKDISSYCVDKSRMCKSNNDCDDDSYCDVFHDRKMCKQCPGGNCYASMPVMLVGIRKQKERSYPDCWGGYTNLGGFRDPTCTMCGSDYRSRACWKKSKSTDRVKIGESCIIGSPWVDGNTGSSGRDLYFNIKLGVLGPDKICSAADATTVRKKAHYGDNDDVKGAFHSDGSLTDKSGPWR